MRGQLSPQNTGKLPPARFSCPRLPTCKEHPPCSAHGTRASHLTKRKQKQVAAGTPPSRVPHRYRQGRRMHAPAESRAASRSSSHDGHAVPLARQRRHRPRQAEHAWVALVERSAGDLQGCAPTGSSWGTPPPRQAMNGKHRVPEANWQRRCAPWPRRTTQKSRNGSSRSGAGRGATPSPP